MRYTFFALLAAGAYTVFRRDITRVATVVKGPAQQFLRSVKQELEATAKATEKPSELPSPPTNPPTPKNPPAAPPKQDQQ